MKSYYLSKKKKTKIFVAQEKEGMFRIVKRTIGDHLSRARVLCRREYKVMKAAQDRLDEIAETFNWEVAHHTYE